MEYFKIEEESTESSDINEPNIRKSNRRRLKKKAACHSGAFLLHQLSKNILIDTESSKYQMWSDKLRKFRSTSWVVKICTDFAPVYPDLYSA